MKAAEKQAALREIWRVTTLRFLQNSRNVARGYMEEN
jgi:hypothetical protein